MNQILLNVTSYSSYLLFFTLGIKSFKNHACLVKKAGMGLILSACRFRSKKLPKKRIVSSKHPATLIGNLVNRPFYSVCLVAWPWNGSEARGDLALIQTSLILSCKYTSLEQLDLHNKSSEDKT